MNHHDECLRHRTWVCVSEHLTSHADAAGTGVQGLFHRGEDFQGVAGRRPACEEKRNRGAGGDGSKRSLVARPNAFCRIATQLKGQTDGVRL